MDEQYCYKCHSEVDILNYDGAKLGVKKCGNKFSSTVKMDNCPKCGGSNLVYIPVVFLKLWDTNENVRYYVTEDMEIRSGLSTEETETAQEIINKYGAQCPEYSI